MCCLRIIKPCIIMILCWITCNFHGVPYSYMNIFDKTNDKLYFLYTNDRLIPIKRDELNVFPIIFHAQCAQCIQYKCNVWTPRKSRCLLAYELTITVWHCFFFPFKCPCEMPAETDRNQESVFHSHSNRKWVRMCERMYKQIMYLKFINTHTHSHYHTNPSIWGETDSFLQFVLCPL